MSVASLGIKRGFKPWPYLWRVFLFRVWGGGGEIPFYVCFGSTGRGKKAVFVPSFREHNSLFSSFFRVGSRMEEEEVSMQIAEVIY